MASRNHYMRRVYGINSDEYEKMLAAQDGKCAICGTTDPRGPTGYFVIDHNHRTGRIRGLLCNKCNTGLGMFNESIEAFNSAITYIEIDQRPYLDP